MNSPLWKNNEPHVMKKVQHKSILPVLESEIIPVRQLKKFPGHSFLNRYNSFFFVFLKANKVPEKETG